MKKLTVLTMIMALIFGFSSCQKDELLGENAPELRAKKVPSTIIPALTYLDEACLDAAHPFTVNAPLNTNVQVQIEVGEEWIPIYQDAKTDVTIFSFPYTFTTAGTYPVRVKFGAGGFTDQPSITVISCVACVNELTTELSSVGENRTLVVKFKAAQAGPIVIQGGLNGKAEITSMISNVLGEIEHPNDGSEAKVTRWVGNVAACEEVVITIKFTGNNEVGSWSAKRGEDVLGFAPGIIL
jgi:PKD repeat protein